MSPPDCYAVSPRTIFVRMLNELPPNKIMYRTKAKRYTAKELAWCVERGDEVGLNWVSDVIRISSELIARNV